MLRKDAFGSGDGRASSRVRRGIHTQAAEDIQAYQAAFYSATLFVGVTAYPDENRRLFASPVEVDAWMSEAGLADIVESIRGVLFGLNPLLPHMLAAGATERATKALGGVHGH